MEALTLKNKKSAISKGKIKKNIKNVLCRPDPIIWPEITEEESKRLEVALVKHKIDIPEFKKSHWNDLKLIPKDQRPKPPKLKKVDGLLFGITACKDAILSGQCTSVVIEGSVNPRMIVQPIITACTDRDIPVLCLNGLRKITSANFGIPTSCLGVQHDYLPDFNKDVAEIAKLYPIPQKKLNTVVAMNIEDNTDFKTVVQTVHVSACPYLYRSNKKSRVFAPTTQDNALKMTRKFIGQDFIEFSNKQEIKDSKGFMKMMLKRMTNNADRVKRK